MATSEQSRPLSPLLVVLTLVLIGVIVLAVRSLTRDRVEVRVVPVTFQTITSSVSTNGKVEPVQEFQAHAPSNGTIQKVFVAVGQHVVPGTLLLQMDPSEVRTRITSAESALANAQASLEDLHRGGSIEERNRFQSDLSAAQMDVQQAEDRLAADQKIFAKGALGAGELAADQQRLRSAQLTLASAQQRAKGHFSSDDRRSLEARVTDAQAARAAAQATYNNTVIRSPIAGTVYSVPVAAYDFVHDGDDLLDVADLNRIQVRAYFDEPDIGKLARGQAVKIVWDAKPNMAWHGHIELAPTTVITYGTRNVGECIITVDDARGDLLPNTNVTVTVTEAQRFNVLSIPREAFHTDGAADFVFRIVNGKLVRTPVQAGVVNLTTVEITSGLAGKDVVVLGPVTSGRELSNGLAVKQVD